MMKLAPLRCCTFNCSGWNSGISTLQNHTDSLDLCFVQEHWLHKDHLHKIRDISPDFLSVSVSGIAEWTSLWRYTENLCLPASLL